MKQTRCPDDERVLAGIALDDPSVVSHTAKCGRCRALLEDTAGLMRMLAASPVDDEDRDEEGGRAVKLRVAAAMLLLLLLPFAVGRVDPVSDVQGNGLRGRPDTEQLVARAVRDGEAWRFAVHTGRSADEFTVEIWGADSDEPLQVIAHSSPIVVAESRIAANVGGGPRFWLVRASRGGIQIGASVPRSLEGNEEGGR